MLHFISMHYLQLFYEFIFRIIGAFKKQTTDEIPMLFVTTQSHLLTKHGKDSLEDALGIPVQILPLQQMNTEKQFQDKVKEFLATRQGCKKVLLVQALLLNQNEGSLIDCAKFVIQNEIGKDQYNGCCIAMVLQVMNSFD